MMKKLYQVFKASIIPQLILSYTIVVSGVVINILQILSLVAWPLNKHLYRKINYYLTYLFYAPYSALTQWWSGTVCELFIRKEDLKYFNEENSVVIMNHRNDTGKVLFVYRNSKNFIL
jgi:lysophosphatidic acid acyltransferase/lysophosphatidylinositol acyltransferase